MIHSELELVHFVRRDVVKRNGVVADTVKTLQKDEETNVYKWTNGLLPLYWRCALSTISNDSHDSSLKYVTVCVDILRLLVYRIADTLQ